MIDKYDQKTWFWIIGIAILLLLVILFLPSEKKDNDGINKNMPAQQIETKTSEPRNKQRGGLGVSRGEVIAWMENNYFDRGVFIEKENKQLMHHELYNNYELELIGPAQSLNRIVLSINNISDIEKSHYRYYVSVLTRVVNENDMQKVAGMARNLGYTNNSLEEVIGDRKYILNWDEGSSLILFEIKALEPERIVENGKKDSKKAFCSSKSDFKSVKIISGDAVYCDSQGRMWTQTLPSDYAWGHYGEKTGGCNPQDATYPACYACYKLSYAGYDDWRLPSCNGDEDLPWSCELYQFGIDACNWQAKESLSNSSCEPLWDSNSQFAEDIYWSSTENTEETAWVVGDGMVGEGPYKYESYSVRCIRKSR